MSSRILWLDIAKGITIILMVIGHTSIPMTLSNFIYSFHMPLFFIASGWMTNWEQYSIGDFVIRKIRTLLLPFAIYSAIVLMIKECALEGGGEWLLKGWLGYALWFIPVLFFASILGRIIYLCKQKIMVYSMMFFLLMIGVVLRYYNIFLPWTLSSVPYACFLVLLGSELKIIQPLLDTPRWWLLCGGFASTFIISHFWRLDMAWNNILPIFPLTIGAIAGTLMMFSFSSYIAKYSKVTTSVFSAIGKETFVILAFSQVIMMLMIEHTHWSSIVRYSIMFLCLVILSYSKRYITGLLK